MYQDRNATYQEKNVMSLSDTLLPASRRAKKEPFDSHTDDGK